MQYSCAFNLKSLSRRSAGAALAAADVVSTLNYDGPIGSRAESIFWLSAAAEIEHALMVQYLFAAYSVDVEGAGPDENEARDLQAKLLQIAREEMGHFITVQNILMVLGGPLHVERAHSPLTSDIHPFRFKLEPLSLGSVAKYVVAESPDLPPDEIDMLSDSRKALLRDVIQELARESNGGHEILHVGPIFARLIALVRDELDEDDFSLDRAPFQADWGDWGYDASHVAAPSPARGERVLVRRIDAAEPEEARQQIIQALHAIGAQGEFVDSADDFDESHFERFFQIFEALKDLQDANGRLPVWPIAAFPNTSSGSSEPANAATAIVNRHMDEGRITNPRTRAWAQLFNLRYRLLLDVIGHGLLIAGPLYASAPEARGQRTAKGQLHAFAFAEMVRVRQLSAKLVSLPLDGGESGLNAGPPFELGHTVNLPSQEVDRWRSHADRYAAGSRWAEEIRNTYADDADDPFLAHLVEADAAAGALCRKIEADGKLPAPPDRETRFHDVVQALEDGVRGFDIRTQRGGGFHGNFWAEKTRDELIDYKTPFGNSLIVPGKPGDSVLFQRLSIEQGSPGWMPRARPNLPKEKLRLIETWIADQAPDAEPKGAIGLSRPPPPKTEPRRTAIPSMPAPEPVAGVPVFETDVRPLFTDFHRNSMLFRLDLHLYEHVRADYKAILRTLEDGTMPCMDGGGSFDESDIQIFRDWIEGGFQTDGSSMSDPPSEPIDPNPPADPGTGFPDGPYKNHRWRRTRAPVPPGLGAPRYDDIWHFDKDIGWAVNSDGVILATRDGWRTFVQQMHIPTVRLRCIGFANDQVGWVGTIGARADERLLKTTDGGANWNFIHNLPSENPRQICGLWVVDENTVYCAGSNRNDSDDPGPATVLKTSDGGANWTEIDMKAAANARTLIDVFFEDADRGWVVGGVDTVDHPDRSGRRGDLVPGLFRTRDGGRTWTNMVEGSKTSTSGRPYVSRTGVFPQGEWAWKIQKIDYGTLVVATQNYRDGAILRSDDGGETWERLRVNDRQRNSNLEGVGFLDRDNGWVGGYGDITYQAGYSSMTRDGGQNWIVSNSIGNRINRFRLVGSSPYTVYASGDTIYKFSDEPLDGTEEDNPADLAAVPSCLEGWERLDLNFDIPVGVKRLTIRIWERDGRFVRLLADETQPTSGPRTVTWDFTNDNGELEDTGTYIVRVTLDNDSRSGLIYRRPRQFSDS